MNPWQDIKLTIAGIEYNSRITNVGRHIIIDFLDISEAEAKEAIEMIKKKGLKMAIDD